MAFSLVQWIKGVINCRYEYLEGRLGLHLLECIRRCEPSAFDRSRSEAAVLPLPNGIEVGLKGEASKEDREL